MPKQSPEINLAGIKVSKKSATPLYMQVYEQLRKMIMEKRLRAGDRLPASRNFAKDLHVSRIIISQAYEQLLIEGYLVAKTGSGTFVADQLPDDLLNARRKDHSMQQRPTAEKKNIGIESSIVPFQLGTPSLDSFSYQKWFETGNTVLKQLKKFHLGYADTLGYWPLREAIASYLRVSRAVMCEAEQVVVVTGSQQGLNLIGEFLLKNGDSVWMEDPGYPGAKTSFIHAGAKICPIPVENDGADIEYGIKKFPGAKLAYITPSHQFPLGCTLSHAKRIRLLEWASKKNMWILEDDYDSEFRYEGSPLASLQGMDHAGCVVYSGTFSKVLFPGLRLAYLVLPTVEMANRLALMKENIDRQSPMIEQLMLSKFIEEGHFLRHIRKMRLLYSERQKILIDLINLYLGEYFSLNAFPSGMHVICWPNGKIDMQRFRESVKRQKIFVGFIKDYSLQHKIPDGIALGFTAFSKYKMKLGVESLVLAVKDSLKSK